MKQYIKVDLYGQFDDDTRHEFTYPSKLLNQYSFTEATVWAKSISDPRALHGKICKAGADCYVIWGNEYGNYFSYITRNSRDSRGGMAMVTFFVERNHICDGKDIYEALNKLSHKLIVNGDYSNESVEEIINDIAVYTSTKCIPSRINKNTTSSEPTYGYKVFANKEELIDILTFIAQGGYASYDKIILAKDGNVKDNIAIQHITSPLCKYYNIYDAQDAQANCRFINAQDSFNITYRKQGFDNAVIACPAPHCNCEYFQIKGTSIVLSDVSNVNVVFTKTWYFDIRKSTDNTCVDESFVELTVNGRIPDKSTRKLIRFTEEELKTLRVVPITASSPHYHQYNGEVDLTTTNSQILIKMEPKVSKIRVQFNFDNSISSSPVFMQIDETTKIYKDLTQSDRFCGYRARLDFNNVYQVDIPKNPKPVRDYEYNDYQSSSPKWIKWLMAILIIGFIAAVGVLSVLYWSEITSFINNLFE